MGDDKIIYFTDYETKYGRMFLAATDKGVVKLTFGSKQKFDFFAWLEDHFPDYMYEKNNPRALEYVKKVKAFIDGKSERVDVPVELVAKGFKRKVLLALKKVPYGKTVTYGELAALAGSPRASRAAGTACAQNPLPFIIPCHRVVASGNRLGGYGGGEEFKLALLKNEGVTDLKL